MKRRLALILLSLGIGLIAVRLADYAVRFGLPPLAGWLALAAPGKTPPFWRHRHLQRERRELAAWSEARQLAPQRSVSRLAELSPHERVLANVRVHPDSWLQSYLDGLALAALPGGLPEGIEAPGSLVPASFIQPIPSYLPSGFLVVNPAASAASGGEPPASTPTPTPTPTATSSPEPPVVVIATTMPSPAAVPEPASWCLQLLGFALIGVLLRRPGTWLARRPNY